MKGRLSHLFQFTKSMYNCTQSAAPLPEGRMYFFEMKKKHRVKAPEYLFNSMVLLQFLKFCFSTFQMQIIICVLPALPSFALSSFSGRIFLYTTQSTPTNPPSNKSFSKKMALAYIQKDGDVWALDEWKPIPLVVDNGSSTCKAGFAGDDAPW